MELVSDLISRTHTQTGLTVTTSILDRVFETGCKVATDFLENCRILKDALLPKWNYSAPLPVSTTRIVRNRILMSFHKQQFWRYSKSSATLRRKPSMLLS